MLDKWKSAIQNRLYEECIEEYKADVAMQKDCYVAWIHETEREIANEENYPSLSVVFMEKCTKGFSLKQLDKDIIVFASKEGKISARAFHEITKYFEEHKDVDLVYADEDVWMLTKESQKEPDNEIKHRIFPWLKPIWSPDTLFSFQYFGHIFAIRRNAFLDIEWLQEDNYRFNIYDFLLKATEGKKAPGHIEQILFHAFCKGNSREEIEDKLMHEIHWMGAGKDYDFIREAALARRGLKATFVADKKTGLTYPIYEVPGNPLVSILIPSKDNVEVLKQCIRAIYERTTYKNFEIIVIDNGSTAQARMMLESYRNEFAFTYLYQPMEFNFSIMCNIAAKNAKGEYILLLNDDIEVLGDQWLERMLGQASLSHVGAVGAKLLYPDTTLIQHAGINNTVSGPGHKLRRFDDNQSFYYGRNKYIYDMIGVTAACLLMSTARYKQLGGLYDGLRVAYNDVDLCFRIYEKGWNNVQRNDVVMYHHESLSRGDDMQDEAKLKRLHAELEVLYTRHPKLYRVDPYLGDMLNDGEAVYHCRRLEDVEYARTKDAALEVKAGKRLPNHEKMNQMLFATVESCEFDRLRGMYLLKGWAFLPDLDNARYRFVLLLENEKGEVWEVPVYKKFREDVTAVLENQIHVELPGFCCWIAPGTLPKGKYKLWITARDRCSRQKMYRDTEHTLIVEE